MGLLAVGTLLSWKDSQKNAQLLRNKGAIAFINVHNGYDNTPETSSVKWGDEVEYSLIKFDHQAKRCYLLLKNKELYPILTAAEQRRDANLDSLWHYETCGYMIEGIFLNNLNIKSVYINILKKEMSKNFCYVFLFKSFIVFNSIL